MLVNKTPNKTCAQENTFTQQTQGSQSQHNTKSNHKMCQLQQRKQHETTGMSNEYGTEKFKFKYNI